MSKCISTHGEYSDHTPGDEEFVCGFCFVLDEDAIRAELAKTRRACGTLGAVVDRQAVDICRVAGVPMPEDGDADYESAWSRVAEMRRLLEEIVGGELCTHPADCSCTAAQAIRLLAPPPTLAPVEVVDLIAELRASVEAEKKRREAQS